MFMLTVLLSVFLDFFFYCADNIDIKIFWGKKKANKLPVDVTKTPICSSLSPSNQPPPPKSTVSSWIISGHATEGHSLSSHYPVSILRLVI